MSGASERYRGVAPLPPIGGVARELAVDQVADHRVALARIEAGAAAAAVDEALRRVAACRHPSLAPVLATSIEEGGLVLQVEAQADGPLASGAVRMPQSSALLVGADIADAIAALHGAGLAHGGLAADAIVLDASGRPLVMGAGLAGARSLALGAAPPAPSDDLRALGRLLHLLLVGVEPTPGVPPPAGLPPAVNGLVMALLSDDPRRPPPPAEPVAERLRAMAGSDLPAAVRPPEPERPAPPTPPRRGLSDAALAAIVGGIALVAIVLAIVTADGQGLLDGDDEPEPQETFTLPEVDTLTLTVTDEELPLPDVLTDTAPIDTAVPTDTFEVFTDTGPVPGDTTATGQDTGAETDIVTLTG